MGVIEDLNLKTKLKVTDKEYAFELYSIDRGIVKEIKFDNKIYVLSEVEDKKEIPKNTSEVFVLPENTNLTESEHQTVDQSKDESIDRTIDESKHEVVSEEKKKVGRPTEWDTKKNQYIIDNYGKIPTKDIAKHLGKKSKVINARALLLGVATDPRGGKNKRWKDEDKKYIMENYNRLRTNQIAEDLDRTPKAIREMAITLDLKHNETSKKIEKTKAPDNTMLFLNWLEERSGAYFTMGDIVKDLPLSKEKALLIVQHQLSIGNLYQMSKWEFAKKKPGEKNEEEK